MNRSSLYLTVSSLGFLAFGLAYLVAPEAIAARFDITLGSPTAVADFRAAYGGMTAGIGVVLGIARRRREWRELGVLASVVASGGLLAGRLVTIATHGPAGWLIEGLMLMSRQ